MWIDFFHLKDSHQRLTAVGCEDGELFLWLVDLNFSPAKIVLRFVSIFPKWLNICIYKFIIQLGPINNLFLWSFTESSNVLISGHFVRITGGPDNKLEIELFDNRPVRLSGDFSNDFFFLCWI